MKRLYRHLRANVKRLFRRTPRPTILMYHAISVRKTFAAVPPEMFARQMCWLKDNGWSVVSLEECVRRAKAGETGKFCALTFDDGYRDFATEALPVLKAHAFPATVFLIAGKMGGTYTTSDGDAIPLMTWGEARTCLDVPGVEIGSHTMTHPKLAKLSPDEAQKELAASRDAIMKELGCGGAMWFCYPKGSYNEVVSQLTRAQGYVGSVTVEPGHPGSDTNRFAVPRGLVYGTMSDAEFAALFV